MSNQPSLPYYTKEPRPRTRIARLSDPETSHQAAREITSSGERDRQARLVLAALRNLPGSTSAELAYYQGIDRYITARRLPELESIGAVKRGKQRRCEISGKNALTWDPI